MIKTHKKIYISSFQSIKIQTESTAKQQVYEKFEPQYSRYLDSARQRTDRHFYSTAVFKACAIAKYCILKSSVF